MEVIKLTFEGTSRVLNGETGATFVVNRWTEVAGLRTAHVRDYRYKNGDCPYQVWSLAPRHYELVKETTNA
jgi:hypothetical protein